MTFRPRVFDFECFSKLGDTVRYVIAEYRLVNIGSVTTQLPYATAAETLRATLDQLAETAATPRLPKMSRKRRKSRR